MFQSAVRMHLAKVSMTTEVRNDETIPVAAFGLNLKPLTPKLARELSTEIADHCFDEDGDLRGEVTGLKFRLAERQQHVTVRMATDAGVHTVLRHVRCVGLEVSKRGEAEEGEQEKKSKKVSPGAPVLRAKLNLLVDPDDASIREFLMRRFGSTFYFEFADEEQQLNFEPEDDKTPKQPRLKMAPKPDPEAGDVLDEQTSVEADKFVERVCSALSEFSIKMTPAEYRKLPEDLRTELVVFLTNYEIVKKEMGDAVTFDDLPKPPASLFDPKRQAKGPVAAKPAPAQAPEPPKKERAQRRSSKEFTNKPRLAGTVKKAKGKNRQKDKVTH